MADSDFGSPDPYRDLPEDSELAFLQLEEHFRRDCERRLEIAGQNERHDVIYVDYMADVLGAITALDLQAEFHSKVPKIDEIDFNSYLNFNKDVRNYRTILKIKHTRRAQGFSVQFDETAKLKIRHHLTQLREFFGRLEVDEDKRENLIARLEELEHEVNMGRTHFDKYAALSIETAGIVGDVVEKSKILEILDAVGRVFWGAKTEKPKQLPAPGKPKQIEAPKPEKLTSGKCSKGDMDDEVPF